MKYYNYIDIPNWKILQKQLIEHCHKNLFRTKEDIDKDPDLKWWCYFPEQIKKDLPDVFYTFKRMGLSIKQMIYFTNMQNDILITDSSDPKSLFIHTDHEDNLDARYDTNVPLLTNFQPTNALNIPLENCEGSSTLFYRRLNNNGDVFYPMYNCGGHACTDVEEVERFELYKPAVLRINVPHAVYNPHHKLRSVATFRFNESLETYLV